MMMNTSKHSSVLNKRKVRLLLDRDLRNKYIADQLKIGLRNQLRSLRDERKLTQAELAEMIGTKQSVISRIERDPVRVGLPVFMDIAEKLDVAFVARFESIDTVVEWYDNPSVKKMTPQKSEQVLKDRAFDLMTEVTSDPVSVQTIVIGQMAGDCIVTKLTQPIFQHQGSLTTSAGLVVKTDWGIFADITELKSVDVPESESLYDPIGGIHYGESFERHLIRKNDSWREYGN